MPSRHEALFYGGRQGPNIARIVLQITYILSILYFSSYVSVSALDAYKHYKKESTGVFATLLAFSIICPLILVITWIVFLPRVIKALTITTNVSFSNFSNTFVDRNAEGQENSGKGGHGE